MPQGGRGQSRRVCHDGSRVLLGSTDISNKIDSTYDEIIYHEGITRLSSLGSIHPERAVGDV